MIVSFKPCQAIVLKRKAKQRGYKGKNATIKKLGQFGSKAKEIKKRN